jgi:predicted Zn-dependent peptidase
VENGSARLARERMIRDNSPLFRLRELLYGKLFGRHPYGEPVIPPPGAAVDTASVSRYRDLYFSGEKVVAVLVSGMPEEEAVRTLSGLFGKLPDRDSACDYPDFAVTARPGRHRVSADIEGVYFLAGLADREDDPETLAAAAVAAEILDRRMKNRIREKQGLAYSTGAAFRLLRGGFVVEMHAGTRMANHEEASLALTELITGMVTDPPGKGEIDSAVSRIRSLHSRRGLASIGEAFSASLDIFLLPEGRFMDRVAGTGVDAVSRVIERSFDPERIVFLEMLPERDQKSD